MRRSAGTRSNRLHRATLLLCNVLCLASGATADQTAVLPVPPPDQAAQYRAERPKSIVELQQFRGSTTRAIQLPGNRPGTATLTNLNPHVNAWYLLTVEIAGARRSHLLENPEPRSRRIDLEEPVARGLTIIDDGGARLCELWSASGSPLDAPDAASLAFAPMCEGRLYLRNRIPGHRTSLERFTDFLRDELWKGDAIVGFVREGLFHDAFSERGSTEFRPTDGDVGGPEAPVAAALNPDAAKGVTVKPPTLGIKVDRASPRGLVLGQWHPASGIPGVHVSVMQSGAIAPALLDRFRESVNRLDAVEAAALDYLIAFDLSQFELGFALGTDHPRLNWSPRPPAQARNQALPGPDGVGTAAPLVTTGMVNPAIASRVVATFTGGFKREHGAFRHGPMALVNHGSHYGFIEQGIVFSKLQPGLATIYVLDDGTVEMATWTEQHDRMLGRIRFARQNGVALIERDPATGGSVPGPLVNRWGPGNWSGSADESLRSLRAGACVQEGERKRFLIYGWFSTATPSAMARVFQAYGCRYAMLLDMNALEHTYLAVYARQGDRMVVQHLVEGMAQVDRVTGGQLSPRFIGMPDNRDFFYLTRRREGR